MVGRPLEEVRAILEAAGVKMLSVQETRSPRGGPAGPRRVVRQQDRAEGVELTAAASAPLIGAEEGDVAQED